MNGLGEIKDWLEKKTGMDNTALGPKSVENAVRHRLQQCDCGRAADYLSLLHRDEDELSRLIDLVVVPESWFFRDEKPFDFLSQIAAERASAPLRILSAPCAAGEEPFSIAIALFETGLAPKAFTIDAVDISHRLIRQAHGRCYRPAALRRELRPGRGKFFIRDQSQQVKVVESVGSSVRFEQGNLLDPGFGEGRRAYDIIFCRNLLIYLKDEARQRLIDMLDRILVKGGLLFVGHAEAGARLQEDYQLVDFPGAFAFKKAKALRANPRPAPVATKRDVLPRKRPQKLRETTLVQPVTLATPIAEKKRQPCELLESARQLADIGRLSEAESICRAALQEFGPDSGVFFLLGLVEMAGGRKGQAEAFFLKVVYLDPRHSEALTHLAMLADSRGDGIEAGRWRRWVENVRNKE